MARLIDADKLYKSVHDLLHETRMDLRHCRTERDINKNHGRFHALLQVIELIERAENER